MGTIRELIQHLLADPTREQSHEVRVLYRELIQLIAHVLNIPWARVFSELDRTLSRDEWQTLQQLFRRRLEHVPIQRILKQWDFYELRDVFILPGVFVPRPETEVLIEALEAWAHDPVYGCDLGCGTGVLSISFLKKFPCAHIVAVDILPKALLNTRINALRFQVYDRIHLLRAPWFSAFTVGEIFDVILCNPPYVSSGEWRTLSPEVRFYDPYRALVPLYSIGTLYASITSEASRRLRKKGLLILEIPSEHVDEILDSLLHTPWLELKEIRKDYAQQPRCLVLRKEG